MRDRIFLPMKLVLTILAPPLDHETAWGQTATLGEIIDAANEVLGKNFAPEQFLKAQEMLLEHLKKKMAHYAEPLTRHLQTNLDRGLSFSECVSEISQTIGMNYVPFE